MASCILTKSALSLRTTPFQRTTNTHCPRCWTSRPCLKVLAGSTGDTRRFILASPLALLPWLHVAGAEAAANKTLDTFTPMDALRDKDYGKARIRYPDYVTTTSGLQYKDFREGTGEVPQAGDMVTIDWDGYTIGYYGRPFEARNKPKGSSFNDENKDYLRFVLGQDLYIPAFEEAISTMKVGCIRRIIVPEELGYPDYDWRKRGPKPSTFAGERALGFVLENRGMIDKTLMFDIDLKAVVKAKR